jgi:hypothetical protein
MVQHAQSGLRLKEIGPIGDATNQTLWRWDYPERQIHFCGFKRRGDFLHGEIGGEGLY